MKLLDYLKAENIAVSAFAARLGEAETTIRKIVYGQRQPSLPLAVKISEATGGATTPGELVVGERDAAA
ncbi:MAG: helix-turn-helix transcriptional regulator [Pseudomonadota bacterium]|nr:helix-turn-helix transcriptional regulator [Pseudomonadota bacterium]